MSVAFAITTKKVGLVYSDGRLWLNGKYSSDDWDKTFEFKFDDKHFIGCHTGILIIQEKPVKEHIGNIIKKYFDNIFKKDLKFVEKDLLDKIEGDFSDHLSNANEKEFDESNTVVDVILVLPSFNIASFKFKLDGKKKSVESQKDIYKPLDKYARVVIGEDNLHGVIHRHLDGIKNFRFENLKLLCNNTMKAALAESEILIDDIRKSGGTIFVKIRR
jgi:hypothetical protein